MKVYIEGRRYNIEYNTSLIFVSSPFIAFIVSVTLYDLVSIIPYNINSDPFSKVSVLKYLFEYFNSLPLFLKDSISNLLLSGIYIYKPFISQIFLL